LKALKEVGTLVLKKMKTLKNKRKPINNFLGWNKFAI
jgi:hypothetical protein